MKFLQIEVNNRNNNYNFYFTTNFARKAECF